MYKKRVRTKIFNKRRNGVVVGQKNKTTGPFGYLSKIRGLGAILKASINNNPEEIIKTRNRHTCVAITSSDLAWQPLYLLKQSDDRRLLERICDAYILSKKHQSKSGPYAVTGMWEGILEENYRLMISAAKSRDITMLGGVLENIFRKNSRGLSMSGNMPSWRILGSLKQYLNNYTDLLLRLALFVNIREVAKDMDNDLYIIEKKISARSLWKKICTKINIDPDYPVVGNPFGVLYPDTKSSCVIPAVASRHLYTAIKTHELIKKTKNASILEIGGGFGGVLYYIFKLAPKGTHLNLKSIDVPEINIISSYFLSKALPNIPVYFYGEKDFSSFKGQGNSIFVLPNWSLQEIALNSVTLVINEDSFPEIPSNSMIKYLERIAEISQYFYSINQDCGRIGQNRLSQVKSEQLGLECLSNNISWMRHGYFERVYQSKKNT